MHIVRRLLSFASLAVALAWTPRAAGQTVAVTSVRVGFPNGSADVQKIARWAPIAVEVELTSGAAYAGELTAETTDPDGAAARSTPLGFELTATGEKRRLFTRLKIGPGQSNIRILLRQMGTTQWSTAFHYPRDTDSMRVVRRAVFPSTTVVIAIGKVSGLEEIRPADGADLLPAQRNWQIAYAAEFDALPRHWTGYDAADAIILSTGDTWQGSVAQRLLDDPERRAALEQWVEMGGHLIVSVGINRDAIAAQPWLAQRLPATVVAGETISVNELRELVKFAGGTGTLFGCDLARLAWKDHARILIEGRSDSPRAPAAVSAAFGGGRVTLLAFDVDAGPFTQWSSRANFWTRLINFNPGEWMARSPTSAGRTTGRQREEVADIAFQLSQQIETFADMPALSFTAVAGLMFLFVLLVGPIEYLLLRRIFRRMEATWLLFPLLVAGTVGSAWLWTRTIKSDEVHVNKVDLVDLDLRRSKVLGHSWLTVYSPAAREYDIDVSACGPSQPADATTVSWMGRPGDGARSYGRSANFAFFRGEYYLPTASALPEHATAVGVPIQVASMKTLSARWSATLPELPFQHDLTLVQEADINYLRGNLTSRLSEPLHDCYLLFADKVWSLGTLQPGRVTPVPTVGKTAATTDLWSARADTAWEETTATPGLRRRSPSERIRRLLSMSSFHRLVPGNYDPPPNEALRVLDQSWRLDLKLKEAILVGNLDALEGGADTIASTNRLGCRVTLSESSDAPLRQSTFVRVFIPVRAP